MCCMAGPWCTEYRGSGVQPTMTTVHKLRHKKIKNYGHAIIVFDGYHEELSTKHGVHERRTGGSAGPIVDFTRDIVMTSKKEDLLSNKENKKRFIMMLGQSLEHVVCKTNTSCQG